MQVLPAKIDTTDRLLSIAMLLVGGMVLATLLRYPSVREHLKLGLIGLALVCVAATLTFFLGSGPLFAAEGKKIGVHVGVLTGLMWVAEISFNNFVDPRISTGGNRFYVDNSFWAAIALVILITSFATASKCHKISAGVRVGLWSGYISGTISCLMALSLVLFGMRFLLRDPINIEEYATRASGAPSFGMASYFAYETMAGALAHLFVLGIVMGLLLGLLGGLMGQLLAQLHPASH